MDKHEAIVELRKWFDKLDLKNWWDRKVEDLSKGMAQKLQFIVTVIHKPKLLILDEPFSGFDPINTKLIKRRLLLFKNSEEVQCSISQEIEASWVCMIVSTTFVAQVAIRNELGDKR
jgi:ABC-type uncharacterized transport system ATPase subunit